MLIKTTDRLKKQISCFIVSNSNLRCQTILKNMQISNFRTLCTFNFKLANIYFTVFTATYQPLSIHSSNHIEILMCTYALDGTRESWEDFDLFTLKM